ncbi:hypothetical protein Tco_1161634, partial [Tanacetum coccineum]
MQLEDEDIQEEVQTESRDVPQPCKSSSRHEISKPFKLSKSQHVSHPHKLVRKDDIQESQSKVLRKRQAYMQSEDQEIQEEVQTESGDHEDYSEDDHEVNSPQTETEIGSIGCTLFTRSSLHMRRHWWIPQVMLNEQNKKNRSFNLIPPAVAQNQLPEELI